MTGTRTLVQRGGIAAGDTSKNPTATAYDTAPPSSTYHGPKVGSEGGFIGLVVGLFVFVCLVGGAIVLVLRCRRQRASKSARRTHNLRGWQRTHDVEDTDDAFEMPAGGEAGFEAVHVDSPTRDRRQWLNPSTMSLEPRGADDDVYRDPAGAESGISLHRGGGEESFRDPYEDRT